MEFSVVVPTYNRADLLPATLESILGQTLPPAEVIVVDDGSVDDTEVVLNRYGPAVRAIRIDNSGDLVARNIGLRAARCPLVAFCDSDDLWRADFLLTMAELWRAAPTMTGAYANFVLVRDDIWEAADKFAAAPPGYWDGLRQVGAGLAVSDQPMVDRLIRFQPFFTCGMTVNRDRFLAAGGWDESVSRIVGCDFATALRVAEHPPIGLVMRPLVGVRKHGGNISGNVQKMNLGDARILEMLLTSRPSLDPYRDLIRASIARRRLDALDTAFARGDLDAVRTIRDLLPPGAGSLKTRIKTMVAALPPVIRAPVARLLTGAAPTA